MSFCLLQYLIIWQNGVSIRLRLPSEAVECGCIFEVHYEISKIFNHLPGVIVEVGVDFKWKDRGISGRSRCVRADGKISLHAERRGEYLCGGAVFFLSDMAGFFTMQLKAGAEEYIEVLPGKTEAGRELDSLSPGGLEISRRNRIKRSDELIEIRQYFPGDDIRRINWKAFAHSGELFIRVGEEKPLPESKLMIMLDLSDPSDFIDEKNSSIYLDFIISRLSGILEKLGSAGITVELSLPPNQFEIISDTGFLTALWWRDDDGMQPPDVIRRPAGRNCLLITHPFSKRAEGYCRLLSASGISVSVVMPVPSISLVESKRFSIENLFFSRELSRDRWIMDEKTAGSVMDKAVRACRELKTSGGAANAFLT